MTQFGHGFIAGGNGNDAYTKILLHMDGANGGFIFPDDNIGGSPHTWSRIAAQTSTATQKFGPTSMFISANGGLTTPDHADFTLGSGDFTVDFWFFVSTTPGTTRLICGQMDPTADYTLSSIEIGMGTDNKMNFLVAQGATPFIVTSTSAYALGAPWHHCACVRFGNVLKLFMDGVQEGGNIAITGAINDSAASFGIGRAGDLASLYWSGYIDEFRLSKGIARWTANFTPPTVPYS